MEGTTEFPQTQMICYPPPSKRRLSPTSSPNNKLQQTKKENNNLAEVSIEYSRRRSLPKVNIPKIHKNNNVRYDNDAMIFNKGRFQFTIIGSPQRQNNGNM